MGRLYLLANRGQKDSKEDQRINTRTFRGLHMKVLGKPEPLKFDLAGLWSRRIDLEHRLVYQAENSEILIYACRFHYDNK